MRSTIEYRILRKEDKAKYRQIRLECLKNHPENFGSVYEDEVLAKNLKFDEIIEAESGSDFLYGAFEKEHLVGICGNISEKRLKTAHISEISHVYVMPQYTNRGICTELTRLTMEKVFENKGIEQIVLGVVGSNTSAIGIYEKAGFVKYGIHENYFKTADQYQDLVLMVLKR